jgi:hypothetical protein
MSIRDLSSHTSRNGETTAVWIYEDADTIVVQHQFVHLSFYDDDFRQFVETLVEAVSALDSDNVIKTPVANGLTLVTTRD